MGPAYRARGDRSRRLPNRQGRDRPGAGPPTPRGGMRRVSAPLCSWSFCKAGTAATAGNRTSRMNDGEGRTTKGGFLSVLAVAVFAACGPSNGSGGGSDAPAVHTLKVTVTGDGTVLTNPAGINCGTVCSATFPEGTTVAFGAKGGDGSNFTGWSGACSGASACLIVMHADATVNATFVAGAPPPPNPPPENPPPPPNPPPRNPPPP